ncbi:lysophospholipid acyltransferase family protein [Chitinophagaceae bacterium MMS25-I14]
MYYLLFLILYPFSLLPLRVLYLLSDGMYGLLYYVIGYRKKIVRDNLEHAFPEKRPAELNEIMKRFYHSFCDQWVETLKLLSVSKAELDRRITGNWDVFEQLHNEGKNTYALLGHTFNWEWANVACQYHSRQQFAGVYLPLENKVFDRLMRYIRMRSGSALISMKAFKSGFQDIQRQQHIIGMIADQNPSVTEVALWLPFMHREAPFFRGPEQMARRARGAVVFAGIHKEKRGHYRIKLELVCHDASETMAEDITRQYVAFMERQLREQPENWLWSHRRWKHTRKK